MGALFGRWYVDGRWIDEAPPRGKPKKPKKPPAAAPAKRAARPRKKGGG